MARNGVQFNMWLSEEEKARIQEKANQAGNINCNIRLE